ncbi:GGDEF domain-containing protein [Treponema parvum]|uniref:GGDEF domain-containing protein n=1 Tax=Treponema parvum TaxID=138851 RepID=UPI001AEBEB15|nr:GGDEF domain-containing protein [Treponema parvum]QTQ15722.1 GGDEF domain-containing protein [Treponema parvum]
MLEFKYVFSYIAVEFFFIVFSVSVLNKLTHDIGIESEIKFFKRLIYTYLLYLFSDIIWILIQFKFISPPLMVKNFVMILNIMFVAATSYFWFCFAEIKLKNKFITSLRFNLIVFSPVLLLLVLYLVSIKTGILYSISESAEFETGTYYWISVVIIGMYPTFVALHAFYRIRKEKSVINKKEYSALILFVFFPVICSVINSFISSTPVVAPAIFSSIFFVFITLQELKIYNDALTGLNNRRRAEQYIIESINSVAPEKPFYFFILDINSFKYINDTFGHAEGDRALRLVAEILKRVCMKYQSFTARWGGDEFIVVVYRSNLYEAKDLTPEDFIKDIYENWEAAVKAEKIPYKFSASIGYTKCALSDVTMTQLIIEADKMLYKNKQLAHKKEPNGGAR